MNARSFISMLSVVTVACGTAAEGTSAGAPGVLVAAQMHVTQDDYRTEDTFREAVERVLRRVEGACPDPAVPRLVVFPENVGLPLVVAGARPVVFRLRRMNLAIAAVAGSLIVRNAGFRRTFGAWMQRTGGNVARATGNALLTHGGRQALAIMIRVFGDLARRYRATLCAGSLACPWFELAGGGAGAPRFADAIDVYNTSLTFDPSGRVINVTRKVYPTDAETGIITPGRLADLQAFDTPIGRVGVLVCADGWYPDCYRRYAGQRVDVLVQPSLVFGLASWNVPWGGYSGFPEPADVDPCDIGRITETQAWMKYSLAGRIGASGARYGANPFLVGGLWDHEAGGWSRTVTGSPASGYRPVLADDPARPAILIVRTETKTEEEETR
jgi:predicted amidohydrolase